MSLKSKWRASKIAFWITFKWSNFLNWINANFFKKVAPVPVAQSTEEASKRVSELTYSEDQFEIYGINVKHSFMGSAEWIQWHLNNGLVPQTDCDEFARYAIRLLSGVVDVFIPRLLTIRWELPDGTIQGHNTCVFQYMDDRSSLNFGTLCNWGLRKDYGTVDRAARHFAEISKGKLLAYTVSDENLRILKYVKC